LAGDEHDALPRGKRDERGNEREQERGEGKSYDGGRELEGRGRLLTSLPSTNAFSKRTRDEPPGATI